MSGEDERWEQVDALFAEALDKEPGERRAFLDRASNDPEVRARVERLLEAEVASEGFLTSQYDVAAGLARAMKDDLSESLADKAAEGEDRDRRIGERLGAYRIQARVGQGGMGTVYLADRADGSFEQEVAIKVIRRGRESRDVAQRLRAEREILSSLQHPNIARLMDGGTTEDGLPYLVMEPVRGRPITEFLDANAFSVEARLRLVLDVCDAVGYAHRNLVVHRDLKPSNILVTDDGRAMLLDFGIAKVLSPDRGTGAEPLTRTGHVVLTPEYSSPEQVRGEAITTASDVYQLGILLYRILTGRHPYDVEGLSPARLESVVAETVPPRPSDALDGRSADVEERARARRSTPSRLGRRLQGDLDTIVLKALRKEPERRYASADALARDLRRHLAGRPVSAQPDTWAYRTRKFLGRHVWVAPAAAALVLASGGYLYTVVRHAAALEAERDVARQEAERAEEVQGFLVDLFRSADPYASPDPERGTRLSVAEALDLGAERASAELEDRPEIRGALLSAISQVFVNLDDLDRAEAIQRDVVESDRSTFGAESRETARSLAVLAKILARSGQSDSANALYERLVPLTERAFGADHPAMGAVLADQGWLKFRLRSLDEAVGPLQRATALLEGAGPEWRQNRIDALTFLSDVHRERGELPEARAAGEAVLALTTEAFGADHIQTLSPRNVVGGAFLEEGDLEQAEVLYRENAELAVAELGEDHEAAIAALNNLARVVGRQGKHAESEEIYGRMVAIAEEKWGPVHVATADLKQNMATVLAAQDKVEEAEVLLGEAYETYRQVLEPGHYLVGYPLVTRSGLELQRGAWEDARRSLVEAVEILRGGLPEGHFAISVAECRLGRAHAGLEAHDDARALLEPAVERLLASPQASPNLKTECGEALEGLYRTLGEEARATEVAQALEEALGS